MSGGTFTVSSAINISGSGFIKCSNIQVLGGDEDDVVEIEDGVTYSGEGTHTFILPDGLGVGDEYQIRMNWSNATTGKVRLQFETWVNDKLEDLYFSLAIRGSSISAPNTFRKSSKIGGVWATGADEITVDSWSEVSNPFSGVFYIHVAKTTSTTTTFEIRESDNTTVYFSRGYNDAAPLNLDVVNRLGFALLNGAIASYELIKLN